MQEVIDFYSQCGFDYGLSVDHVILAFKPELDDSSLDAVPVEWRERQKLTLELAKEFLNRTLKQKCGFTPVGIAQGWSPGSYARAAKELQKLGYKYIAMGGMVPLKTTEILASLRKVKEVLRPLVCKSTCSV